MEISNREIEHNASVMDAMYDFEDFFTGYERDCFKDAWNVARDMFDRETMSDEFNHCIVQHMIDCDITVISLPRGESISLVLEQR